MSIFHAYRNCKGICSSSKQRFNPCFSAYSSSKSFQWSRACCETVIALFVWCAKGLACELYLYCSDTFFTTPHQFWSHFRNLLPVLGRHGQLARRILINLFCIHTKKFFLLLNCLKTWQVVPYSHPLKCKFFSFSLFAIGQQRENCP